MVEALTSKATEWEKERGVEFSYDGVRTSRFSSHGVDKLVQVHNLFQTNFLSPLGLS